MTIDTALVEKIRNASRQSLGFEPRDCQWRVAQWLQQRQIVEMETGEGKTLAVAIAAIVHALEGHRTFVATANDYLAERDAQQMSLLYSHFGLRTRSLNNSLAREERLNVYDAEIVYGTIRELGFDSLRDAIGRRTAGSQYKRLVPAFHTLIIDEVDSVLIDEPLTPLVISDRDSSWTAEKASLYRWSAAQVGSMDQGRDYVVHEASGHMALTDQGIAKVIHQSMPPTLDQFRTIDILHSIERAIDVSTRWKRDIHYLVREDRILIVDAHTGRVAESKQMSGGVHQAIEAQENLPITAPTCTSARITIQEIANRVPHLCGVTATAREERREFDLVYNLKIKVVPAHQVSRRRMLPWITLASEQEKEHAIVEDIKKQLAKRRPVLIGTRSIESSETLADSLRHEGIHPQVLNARQSREEAAVIALAGQEKQVTVATNMAGRGTDIRLSQAAREAGGLHVIIAEPHAVARLDRQLAGRCGRQGDPGTVQRYIAADDQLFKIAYGSRLPESWLKRIAQQSLIATNLAVATTRAQAFVSRSQRNQRRLLAETDARMAADLRTLGLDPYLDRLDTSD